MDELKILQTENKTESCLGKHINHEPYKNTECAQCKFVNIKVRYMDITCNIFYVYIYINIIYILLSIYI